MILLVIMLIGVLACGLCPLRFGKILGAVMLMMLGVALMLATFVLAISHGYYALLIVL